MEGVKKPAYRFCMLLHSLTAVAALTFAADPSPAVSTRAEARPPSKASLFGAVAPAALPAGTIAFYGLVGAPDLVAGYRQGFAPFELEARAAFNYLDVSAFGDVALRFSWLTSDRLQLAPVVGLGLKASSGARYFDKASFPALSLRPRLGLVASYLATDTVSLIGHVDVPWAIALTAPGHQLTPTVGAGAEFAIGSSLSVVAMAQAGVDVVKEPLGVTQARFAWGARVGLGFRLF